MKNKTGVLAGTPVLLVLNEVAEGSIKETLHMFSAGISHF
jgi:hypothetical protein